MHYERVKVVKDPVATVMNRSVPAWEISVLEFLFGSANVQRQGEYELVEREYPLAFAEFDRLEKAYGADTKSGVPHVVAVYGSGDRGIRALQTAIDNAESEDQARTADGSAPRRQLATVPKTVATRDSLLA
jgi:hypothetical protein